METLPPGIPGVEQLKSKPVAKTLEEHDVTGSTETGGDDHSADKDSCAPYLALLKVQQDHFLAAPAGQADKDASEAQYAELLAQAEKDPFAWQRALLQAQHAELLAAGQAWFPGQPVQGPPFYCDPYAMQAAAHMAAVDMLNYQRVWWQQHQHLMQNVGQKKGSFSRAADTADKKAGGRAARRQQGSKEDQKHDSPGEAITEDNIVELSMKDESSSRRVQDEIFKNSEVSMADKRRYAVAFKDKIMRAIKSQAANFVVKAMIEALQPADLTFIMQELSKEGNAKVASMDQCGCRSVILLVTLYNHLESMEKLIDQLLEVVPVLVRNEYGHHVVDALVQHGQDEHRYKVAMHLCSHPPGAAGSEGLKEPMIVNHAKHRRASYCVQKVIEKCDPQVVTPLQGAWEDLLQHSETLFLSQSGCHVLKTLWEVSSSQYKGNAKTNARSLGEVPSSPYKGDGDFHRRLDEELKRLEVKYREEAKSVEGSKYGLKLMTKEIQELRVQPASTDLKQGTAEEQKQG